MNGKKQQNSERPWPIAAPLVLLCLAAFVLRFAALGVNSLSTDESVSVALARAPWHSFWLETSGYEANMVLYYTALRGWVRLFGDSEIAVRSLSALFGVLAIPSLYILGRTLFGRTAGLLAAAVLTVHSGHIQFSQEARSYSLTVLLLIWSALLFLRVLRSDATATHRVLYVAISAASVYSHLLSVLFLLAQWAAAGPRRLSLVRGRMIALMSLGALVLPMALFVLFRNSGQLAWVPRPGIWVVVSSIFFALSGTSIFLPIPALFFAVAGVERTETAADSEGWDFGRRFAIFYAGFPVAIMLAVSLLGRPILTYRYAGLCIPGCALLMGRGLEAAARRSATRRRRIAIVVLLLLVTASTLQPLVYSGSESGWRAATRYVISNAEPHDGIVFYIPAGLRPFEYYARRFGAGAAPAVLFPVRGGPHERFQLASNPDATRRLWVVLHHSRQLPAGLALRCHSERTFGRPAADAITVRLCSEAPLAAQREARE